MTVRINWKVFKDFQELEGNQDAYAIYLKLSPAEQIELQARLTEAIEITLEKIKLKVGPKAVSVGATQTQATSLALPEIPPLTTAIVTSEANFKAWFGGLKQIVEKHGSAIMFKVGSAVMLPPSIRGIKTITIPIAVQKNGILVARSDFVAHFHPDAKRAGVGNPNASHMHLKPDDYKTFHIDFDMIPKNLRTAIKDSSDRCSSP